MLGKTSHLSPLQVRKQLLIVESEINRAQLQQDWLTISQGLHQAVGWTRTITTWTSAALLLVKRMAGASHSKVASTPEKESWFQGVLRGAELVCRLWMDFRNRSG